MEKLEAMDIEQAVSMIKAGVPQEKGIWADIGAGTGMFTQALDRLLPEGSTVIAVDKSPHPLYYLRLERSTLRVEEGDFTRKMDLPMLDGIVMANALHCVDAQTAALRNVLQHLRPGGSFVLVEYERTEPIVPWIPYPVPQAAFREMAAELGLGDPVALGSVPSQFGHSHIYALAVAYVREQK